MEVVAYRSIAFRADVGIAGRTVSAAYHITYDACKGDRLLVGADAGLAGCKIQAKLAFE